MNASSKKFLRILVRCNFRSVRFKFSTTSGPPKVIENQRIDKKQKKNKQSSGWSAKEKILNLVLASEISPYLNQSSLSFFKHYLNYKCNITTEYSFLVDFDVAKDIVDRIVPDLKEERSFVVEANPGLGLITLNLIKSQVPKIHVCENSKFINVSLQQLINEHPQQLELQNCNIFIPKCYQFLKILDNAIKLNVNNKIIGVVQQPRFFSSFIQDCVLCSLWNCLEVTDFFLIVTKNVWKNIMQCNESRGKYVTYCFFNLIFQTELLAEYPSSAFLPYSFQSSENDMFFVKISKRPDFPGRLTDKDLKLLMKFCKILGRSKFNYIIPTVEQWIPDCGPYLISKGISVTNQTNDLSFKEFQKLYLFLKKFKGFKNLEILE